MTTHELKIWPEFFQAILDGRKTFELRERRDRDFSVGDELWLREWEMDGHFFTGRDLRRRVTFILDGGQFGVEPGFCVMALSYDLDSTGSKGA